MALLYFFQMQIETALFLCYSEQQAHLAGVEFSLLINIQQHIVQLFCRYTLPVLRFQFFDQILMAAAGVPFYR